MIVQIQPKDYWYKLLLECDVDESHAVAVRKRWMLGKIKYGI